MDIDTNKRQRKGNSADQFVLDFHSKTLSNLLCLPSMKMTSSLPPLYSSNPTHYYSYRKLPPSPARACPCMSRRGDRFSVAHVCAIPTVRPSE